MITKDNIIEHRKRGGGDQWPPTWQ